MKKIFTLLFLIVAVSLVSAQSYRPFPEPGYFWNEEHGMLVPGNCGYDYVTCQSPVYFGTDTMINSVSYHRLYTRQICTWQATVPPVPPCQFTGSYNVPEQLFATIRQDTALKQVFLYDNSAGEVLLFDFNLTVGATLPPSYVNPMYPNVWVVRADSLLLADGYHRRYVTNVASFNNDSAALIEGVGSTFGMLAALVSPFENHDILLCLSDGAQTIYPNATATCQLTLGMKDPDPSSFSVYPNPVGDYLDLRPGAMGAGQACIYASDGRLIMQQQIPKSGAMLETSTLSRGLYFLSYAGSYTVHIRLLKL